MLVNGSRPCCILTIYIYIYVHIYIYIYVHIFIFIHILCYLMLFGDLSKSGNFQNQKMIQS